MFLDMMMYMQIFLISLILMIKMYKHMLILMMMMELLMMNLSLVMYMMMIQVNMEFFLIYYLIFMVCESILGLGVIVMIIRMNGNDLYYEMNLSKFK